MPRRASITADEAEQYELPELHRQSDDRQQEGGSGRNAGDSKEDDDEDGDLNLDDSQQPLLAADGVEKEGVAAGDGDPNKQETIGKGSKIDQLIAEVRWHSLCLMRPPCSHKADEADGPVHG